MYTTREQRYRGGGAYIVRGVVLAWLYASLGGCSLSPGMRMVQPPALAVSGGEYSTGPAVEQTISVTDITLNSLKEMREAAAAPGAGGPSPDVLFGTPGPYRLGPGDVLQITVWDHPELAAALGQPAAAARPSDAGPGFVVDHEGNVQFPYVGNVHVAGESIEYVQREFDRRLSRVFVKPQVTVRVASYRAAQVYIDGEVRAPGAQTINDIPMTLTEAINRAGGFSPNADQSRVVIVRDGVSYSLNVSQMIERGQNPARVILKNGDLLRVFARDDNGVYVLGEVNRPATVMPMKNGRLTLSDALSQAGSMNLGTADAKQLFVIRDSMSAQPHVYHLDASSPVSMLLANQFELQPKDVVYIDNNGLVRFNRVLNLLLPAINAGLTAAIVTK